MVRGGGGRTAGVPDRDFISLLERGGREGEGAHLLVLEQILAVVVLLLLLVADALEVRERVIIAADRRVVAVIVRLVARVHRARLPPPTRDRFCCLWPGASARTTRDEVSNAKRPRRGASALTPPEAPRTTPRWRRPSASCSCPSRGGTTAGRGREGSARWGASRASRRVVVAAGRPSSRALGRHSSATTTSRTASSSSSLLVPRPRRRPTHRVAGRPSSRRRIAPRLASPRR